MESLHGIVEVRPAGIYPTGWEIAKKLVRWRGVATRERLFNALYADKPESDQPDDIRIIDMHIFRLRRALKPLGIEIKTQQRDGYYLDNENMLKLRRLIENAI